MPKEYKKYYKSSDAPLTRYASDKIKKEIESRQAYDSREECIDNDNKRNISNKKNVQCSLNINIASDSSEEINAAINVQKCDDTSVEQNIAGMDVDATTSTQNTDIYFENYDSDDELYEILNNLENSKHKKTFAKETDLFELKSINVEKTPAEVMLMVLRYGLANELSMDGIVNLCKLINNVCEQKVIPETRYLIDNLCNSETKVTLHAVCRTCSNYLGIFEESNKQIHCEVCETVTDASNPSNPCYFAYIDPSDSIRTTLQEHEKYYEFVVSQRKHEKNIIKDIYDGNCYRKFVRNLSEIDKYAYVTVSFNSDGAPVFESSNFSIWPIYLIINEIPVEERLKNCIVCCLWFGSKKPEMNIYLDVFVKNMNNLSSVGIPCSIMGQNRIIKCYPLICCVDTVARCTMNGTTQFNGNYGCDWCLHPGQYYGGSMRYPIINPPPDHRDKGTTIAYAKEALKKRVPVFGVKYASPLLLLPHFDIIHGFTPDYLHSFLSGVIKQYTEYLINNLTTEEITAIDEALLKIKAPNHVGRLTRRISERNQWKAKEWENWLLYYSVPILEPMLKDDFLQHWLLLVESLHICLQSSITFSQLNRANKLLYKFVEELEVMTSLNQMTYNVHLMLHIVESVYNWGPLWAQSTFPFEAGNHKLLNAIHSAKGVIPQIVRHLNLHLYVQKLEKKVYPYDSGIVIQFCERTLRSETQKAFKIDKVTFFGRGVIVDDKVKMIANVSENSKMYSKIVIHGCIFATSKKVNKRSCNYFAQLNDGRFVEINNFLADFDNMKELMICRIVNTEPSNNCDAIRKVTHYSEPTVFPISLVSKMSAFLEVHEKSYIVPLPNMLSY